MLSPEKLLALCQEAYTSFNPAAMTMDAHADEFLKLKKVKGEEDGNFIRQVLYGTVRYRRLIQSLLKAFYFKNAGSASRTDAHLYAVFVYLGLFRLQELTFSQFKRLVKSQEPHKMLVFLRFLFNAGMLQEFCRDSWLKMFDKPFVDDLIAMAQSRLPETRRLLDHLEHQVFLSQKDQEESSGSPSTTEVRTQRKTTEPKPFNLTLPKPRLPPPEEPPPEPYRAKPAPKFEEGPTKEELAIEAAKEQNRKAITKKYLDPAGGPFKLRVHERPMKLPELMEEARREFDARHAYRPVVPKPPPSLPEAEVRLNAAAILREDAVYRRKQEQEAAVMMAYEQELRDSSEFERWRASMLAQDERERAEEVERRRREMAAAQDAAIEARERAMAENKVVAERLKEEKKKAQEQILEEQKAREEANAALARKVAQDREAARKAVEQKEAENRAAAEGLRTELGEEQRRVAAQREAELKERQDIIRQLRAMLKAREKHERRVDPTWVPNLGLLGEMSLLELRERLSQVRERMRVEEEAMRRHILKKKEERDARLMAKAANIGRVRRLAHAQALLRRQRQEAEKDAAEQARQAQEDALVLELDEKLRNKREKIHAENERIFEEVRRAKFEQQGLGVSAEQVEELKFLELRKGAEREVAERQMRAKEDAEQYEAAKRRAQKMRIDLSKSQLRAKQEMYDEYDQAFEEERALFERSENEALQRRRERVQKTKAFETTLHQRTGRGPAGMTVRATDPASLAAADEVAAL